MAQVKSKTLVSIGKEKISQSEFEANYKRNNANIPDKKDIKSPEEYLDLFIKFRLKVIEAQSLGYDTVRSFRDELEGYRKELARPYLTDVSYNEEMVKTAYHRTRFERKASHILVKVAPDAAPADTLTAWNKINDLRNQILAGKDFNEMAAKYSEDPSAVQNKGLLGYFTAFQMVYPFEDMTYRTPVGQVSEIIRSRFGYHIIKVHDERPAAGEIKVAHIMKMFPPQASAETINRLKLSADSIWQKANSGEDFAELARKYSDDKQSSADGGVINWFTPNNMVPSFAEASFALKNDGDISPVIRTPYGWHIIKRLERRPVQTLEKLRPGLESKIKQNPQISKHSDEAFDRKLRAEYQLKTDDANFARFIQLSTDSVLKKTIENDTQTRKLLLFSFAGQRITFGDFADYIKSMKINTANNREPEQFKEQFNKFIHHRLVEYENSRLEQKYPEFASLYQEYHDGILLFNISKDKIWDVASNDTLRLQNYFDQATKKYYWNDRFKGWIIRANTINTKANVESFINESKTNRKEDLIELFNTPTDKRIEITDVVCEKGTNPIVDYFIWNGPKPSGFDETTTFVHGKIEKNELKTLKDAWGLYSSDFQESIEKEWINSLQKKYPVKINKNVLNKVQSLQ
jgi:peptidyl-prolyl cis-trans isomerase SurA